MNDRTPATTHHDVVVISRVDAAQMPPTPVATPPAVGSDASTLSPAWDEAFLRVESYLHAHQIESRWVLNRLTNEIVEEARARAVARPEDSPVKLAMEVLHERMARWFSKVFEEDGWGEERFRAKGRLALVMANMPSGWAPRFLADEPLPPEICDALREVELQPGPELRLSKMPPASLEFGFGDTDEKSAAGVRWALHPALGLCVLIVGLMGVAWAASH